MVAILALGAFAIPARANTILFATGPIQLASGTVNATVSFDIDHVTDTILISVANLQKNPVNIGQLISRVNFTLSHFTNTSPNAAVVTERATEIEIDRMGRIVEVDATLDTDWKILPVATGRFDLCTICNGSGDPDQLLIGAPAANGRYPNANGGIAGNNSHNPFLLASAETYTEGPLAGVNSMPSWTIRLNGIQPTTYVTAVAFGFGTSYGALTAEADALTPTPEPGTMILLGCGVALMFAARRRKKKGQAA
jgi:hypothetical protein